MSAPLQSQGADTPGEVNARDETQLQQMMRALSLEDRAVKSRFRHVSNIDSVYTLGDEVMPSGSRGALVKAVLFATRKSDGKKVIVKLRSKRESFKDEAEVSEWTTTMKVLYLISGGAEQERPGASGRLKLIANLVDVVEDSTNYYAVMEHVQGRDLFDYFVQEKIYTKPYKMDIAKQLAAVLLEAMHELHSHGLVHKDLKLENLVFDETVTQQSGSTLRCIPKIIDFDTVELCKGPNHKSLHVLGTDQYIAPETYKGVVSFQVDVWALGVILYTVLTGSFPFHYALYDDQPGENFVGHARMDQISRRLRVAKIDWSAKVWTEGASSAEPGPGSGNSARDFVRSCFVCDPKKRITIGMAREHAWVKDVRIPNEMRAPPPPRD